MLEFMTEPIRFIKESQFMESQFEKPYRYGSYNKMHLLPPYDPEFPGTPRPPNWEFPEGPGGGPFPAPPPLDPSLNCCITTEPPPPGYDFMKVLEGNGIEYYIVFGLPPGECKGDDDCGICTEIVNCWASVTAGPGTFAGMGGNGVDCVISVTNGSAGCSDSSPGSVACSGLWDEEKACTGKEYVRFTARVACKGLCGSRKWEVCEDIFDYPCSDCDGVEAMVWDDEWTDANTPPTIGQSSGPPPLDESSTLTFTGGQAPFTWQILSSEYYFDASGTQTSEVISERTNTIYASSSACGTCNVLVTDDCGNTVMMFLLNSVSNSGWLSITGAIADDDENNQVACTTGPGNCFDSAYCLGATGASNYKTGTGTNAHILYTSSIFDSPIEGNIAVRMKSYFQPQTSQWVYPDNCVDCASSPVDCGNCSSRKANAGSCNYECSEYIPAVAVSVAACNVPGVCATDGYDAVKESLAALCSGGYCYGGCDECGAKRSTAGTSYLIICIFQNYFYRHYQKCP